jgi:hypothetical protein
MVEAMHKIHEEVAGDPRNISSEATEPREVPGVHAILIGGITALLTVAMRVGMHEEAPTVPGPNAPGCRRVNSSKDASTSMDIIMSSVWKSRNPPRITITGHPGYSRARLHVTRRSKVIRGTFTLR